MTTYSSVTTDLSDYAPGSTAIITASGFDTGSAVTFSVQHVSGPGTDGIFGTPDDAVVILGGEGHEAWIVVDGSTGDLDGQQDGKIVTSWYVNPDDSLDERFLLTATTADGWWATSTFTDQATPPADPGAFNDALIKSYTTTSSTGTGVISSFLRVQADGYEAGYNTDGRPLQFDENTALSFTHSITLAQVPTIIEGGIEYYVFNLDLNENNNGDSPLITLQNFKIFGATVPDLANIDTSTLLFPEGLATLLYELDGGGNVSIDLTDWNSGSGTGDYAVYIPVDGVNGNPGFSALAAGTYIYVYTEFGQQDGLGYTTEGGFEEWFVVTEITPELSIDKVFVEVTGGNDNGVADQAGEVLNYTVTVTNTGNVNLTGVTVQDPLTGLDIAGVTLGVGESVTYDTSYTLLQSDLDDNGGGDGDIDNTATADSDETDQAEDSASVPVDQNPALTIEKEASLDDDGDAADEAGDVINYTITVKNTGNQTLTNVTVTDPLLSDSALALVSGDADDDGALDVDETWVYAGTHTVTQDEIDAGGTIDNTATADSDETDQAEDSASVPVDQNPALTIEKEASLDDGGDAADEAGDVINYTITVKNTGNQTLTNVTVTDPLLSDSALALVSGDADDDGALDVDETWSYTGTHTVTQDEIDAGGTIDNTATADSDETDQADDSASVPVDQNPAISIEKSTVIGASEGDDLTGVHAGEDVLWRYTVTNPGNTALSNVHIIDDNGTPGVTADDFSLTFASGYMSGDADSDSKLDVNETWIFEKTGTAIAGTYENIGTAYGSAGESVVSDSDHSSYTATVPSALIAPTGTTAYQYISGTAMSFEAYYNDQGGVIQYGVKGGKIGQTNPGVFFYFTGASGDIKDGDHDGKVEKISVLIDQTGTSSNGTTTSALKPLNNNNIQLYKVIDSGPDGTPDGVVNSYDTLQSVKLGSNSIKTDPVTGDVTVSFMPDAEGSMYVLSVKYDTTKVVGDMVGTHPALWPTVNYDFETWVNGGYAETYEGGIDLAPKKVNTMVLDGDAGEGARAIKAAQAKAVYKAALKYWSGEGFDVSALKKGAVEIADLGKDGDDWILGMEQDGHITIDNDAAGHGWSIGIGAVAPNKVDLFSVLVHEMGHLLGESDEAMGGMLAVGGRELPMAPADDTSLPLPATLFGMIGMANAPAEQHFG